MRTRTTKEENHALKASLSVRGFALLCTILILLGLLLKAPTPRIESGFGVSLPQGLIYGTNPDLTRKNFFEETRDNLILTKKTFIEADLSEMKLSVYKNGGKELEVPIVTKGRKGSWWETPAGIYAIQTKEKSHFSSIGHVYMPYAMQFQGNFFVHGIPTYDNGEEVSTAYSGGCIRLSTNDALQVFEAVEYGAPIIVHEPNTAPPLAPITIKGPEVSAHAYLAADLGNGEVYAAKNSSEQVSIASIAKLVTALVAIEHINLDKTVIFQASLVASTSIPRLTVGESYRAFDLLYPLLEESSNESANLLGSMPGKAYFVSLMNKKASSLGMKSSQFVDPSGAGEGNVSTAEDLFALADHLLQYRSFIVDITRGKGRNLAYGEISFPQIQNLNLFADNPRFLGGKIGKTTAARETMLSLFEIPVGKTVRKVAIIALGSDNIGVDIEKIRQYVAETYTEEER